MLVHVCASVTTTHTHTYTRPLVPSGGSAIEFSNPLYDTTLNAPANNNHGDDPYYSAPHHYDKAAESPSASVDGHADGHYFGVAPKKDSEYFDVAPVKKDDAGYMDVRGIDEEDYV